LEYVAHRWEQTSFDIWEEVKGIHFYTRLVQRRALLEGAQLARRLNDNGAADFYDKRAKDIQASFDRFWDGNRKLLVTTVNRDGGLDYKHSQVDVQVVLAALHAVGQDDFLTPTNDRVQATAARVIEAFRDLYNINRARRDLGTAIGRYPEDQYNGVGNSVGHAWVLATAGMGEMYYKAASAYKKEARIPVTTNNIEFLRYATRPADNVNLVPNETITPADTRFNSLLQCLVREGDLYLARIRYHTAADGNLHEQMHRDTGYMTGAPHLTWSYVAFSTAYDARQEAKRLLGL
jgi:glucoamylase